MVVIQGVDTPFCLCWMSIPFFNLLCTLWILTKWWLWVASESLEGVATESWVKLLSRHWGTLDLPRGSSESLESKISQKGRKVP